MISNARRSAFSIMPPAPAYASTVNGQFRLPLDVLRDPNGNE
jgi:hypothetical protein